MRIRAHMGQPGPREAKKPFNIFKISFFTILLDTQNVKLMKNLDRFLGSGSKTLTPWKSRIWTWIITFINPGSESDQNTRLRISNSGSTSLYLAIKRSKERYWMSIFYYVQCGHWDQYENWTQDNGQTGTVNGSLFYSMQFPAKVKSYFSAYERI